MKTHILSILIFFIAKSYQKTTLEAIIKQRNAKHSKKLPPTSNSRILQPEISNKNNTDVPQQFVTEDDKDIRVFALFRNKNCTVEICTLKEIRAQSDSKKQAREKLQRYKNQCRYNPCDLSGTQACIQSWNHRRCICNELSFGDKCDKHKNQCLNENICGGTSICENLKEKPGYRCKCRKGENYNDQKKKCEKKISSRRNTIDDNYSVTETTNFYGFTETPEITYPPEILEKVTEIPPKTGFFNFRNNLKYTGILKFDVSLKEDCPIHFKKEDAAYYKSAYSGALQESLEPKMQALDTFFPEMYCDNTGLEPEFKFKVWYYFEDGAPIEDMDADLIEKMAKIYKEQIVALSPSEIKLMSEDDVDIKHEWCDKCA